MKILAELPVKEALRTSLMTATNARFVKANGHKFSVANLKVFAVHGCTCVRCGRKGNRIIAWEDRGGGIHVDLFQKTREGGLMLLNRDHIIPRSKKGPNTDWNFQPMCQSCNCKKGANETAQDVELAKFRQHWKGIHVALFNGYWKIIPKWLRFRKLSKALMLIRDLYLHRITYVLAKVTA